MSVPARHIAKKPGLGISHRKTADLRETGLNLKKEIRELELRLLKWQFGIAFALAAIMAKGFGWLGF